MLIPSTNFNIRKTQAQTFVSENNFDIANQVYDQRTLSLEHAQFRIYFELFYTYVLVIKSMTPTVKH